jgi:putative transposase
MYDRRSYRLRGQDYSREGLYFITICTNGNECFFGRINENKMILNDIGKIANEYWLKIPIHFPSAFLHEFVIMPNHVHGIIELINVNGCEFPHNGGTRHGASLHCVDTISPWFKILNTKNGFNINHTISNHNKFGRLVPGSIPLIIYQYKSSVKRWCNKNNYQYFKWQSRFYERVIRNKKSFIAISNYIKNNPARWNEEH